MFKVAPCVLALCLGVRRRTPFPFLMSTTFFLNRLQRITPHFRLYVFFSILSAISVALFPVVTQLFLEYVYPSQNMSILLWFVGSMTVFFLGRIALRGWLRKKRTKMKLKLEKDIREQVLSIRNSTLKEATRETIHKYIESYPKLVTLHLQKVVLEPFQECVKFSSVFIFLLIFQPVFIPFLAVFVPVGAIYVWVTTKPDHNAPSLPPFAVSEAVFSGKEGKTAIQTYFQKEWLNRRGDIMPLQTLRGSVTIFRVLFLGFFGILLFQTSIQLENLVVGLLFITIMARSVLRIVENRKFIYITQSAVEKCRKTYSF